MKKMKLNIQLFANSGTVGSLSGQWKTTYTVTWSLLSQSIENNTSIIRLTSTLYTGNSTTIASDYSNFVTDGTTMYSGSYSKSGAGNVFVKTKDITVQHNPDGSFPGRSVSFSTNDYIMGNQSGSGTITGVPTIPRASTVACSSPYIGDTATITIDKKSSGFTSTVTYNIGGITGTIATKTSSTVLSLDTTSLKSQIYALIPNNKSVSGTIYCATYSGNTQIGNTQSASFNLYTKEEDCKPVVSGTVIDTNQDTIALTGDSSIIVKNASKPKVTVTATPSYSSTISSYSINLNDGQTSNLQEDTFNTINSNSIIVDAIDSRGYGNPTTIDLSNRIVEYVKLHFDTINLNRTESTSNQVILNANGVWFNGDFSQSTSNTLSCRFQYKKSTDSSWTNGGTITPTILGNTFTFTDVSLGNNYDYNDEYQFKVIATDLLTTIGSENKDAQTIPKGIAVVEIGDEFVNVNGLLTVNNEPVSGSDTVPIGSIFNYDGDTVPDGYEEVEMSGSNANGNWIKFDDGTMICTSARRFENVAVTATWGSLYDSPNLGLGSLPAEFINIPRVFITCHNITGQTSNACFIEWITGTTTSLWGSTAVARPTSGTANLAFSLLAIGRWK